MDEYDYEWFWESRLPDSFESWQEREVWPYLLDQRAELAAVDIPIHHLINPQDFWD